ncbi:GGDEF domain-containing protein [Pseudomonas cerasi]
MNILKIQPDVLKINKKPKGKLYKAAMVYSVVAFLSVMAVSLSQSEVPDYDFYFFVNLATLIILSWAIRISYLVIFDRASIKICRIAIFILYNSALFSMAGGLGVIAKSYSSIISAILFVPAILLLVKSFQGFIVYFNESYSSAVGLSLTDELTDLPNRRHFNMMLNKMEGSSCFICMIDIDDFKLINDTYGHDLGDLILKGAGKYFKNYESENIFIARVGGEEFAVLMKTDSAEEGFPSELRRAFNSFNVNGINITTSIGISFKKVEDATSHVLKIADKALYQSKKNGKNTTTIIN